MFLNNPRVKPEKTHLTTIIVEHRKPDTMAHTPYGSFKVARVPNISSERDQNNGYLFQEDYSKRGF